MKRCEKVNQLSCFSENNRLKCFISFLYIFNEGGAVATVWSSVLILYKCVNTVEIQQHHFSSRISRELTRVDFHSCPQGLLGLHV